jgi:sugar phosphate isomerase/epimerase
MSAPSGNMTLERTHLERTGMNEIAGQPRWTLGYEAEGSTDAAWTLRHGAGADTIIYETTDRLGPDDDELAKRWAEGYLKTLEDRGIVIEWEPHHPGPGTSPDFYAALIDHTP